MLVIFHQIVNGGTWLALPGPKLIITAIGDNTEYPGLEGSSAKLVQRTKAAQKGILRGIRSTLGITENAVGYVESELLVFDNEIIKGIDITLGSRSNQSLFVHVLHAILWKRPTTV